MIASFLMSLVFWGKRSFSAESRKREINIGFWLQGGQGGFEDVRKYVKQGGDFCKDLASILHER